MEKPCYALVSFPGWGTVYEITWQFELLLFRMCLTDLFCRKSARRRIPVWKERQDIANMLPAALLLLVLLSCITVLAYIPGSLCDSSMHDSLLINCSLQIIWSVWMVTLAYNISNANVFLALHCSCKYMLSFISVLIMTGSCSCTITLQLIFLCPPFSTHQIYIYSYHKVGTEEV